MAGTKQQKSDTLKPEATTYAVFTDAGVVSVEATSADEAVTKAESKE